MDGVGVGLCQCLVGRHSDQAVPCWLPWANAVVGLEDGSVRKESLSPGDHDP